MKEVRGEETEMLPQPELHVCGYLVIAATASVHLSSYIPHQLL